MTARNRTARVEKPRQDCQYRIAQYNKTVNTGLPIQDYQDRNVRTGQQEQDSQTSTARKGQPEKGSYERLPGRDCQKSTARNEQPNSQEVTARK
jgi:hypothetical protein